MTTWIKTAAAAGLVGGVVAATVLGIPSCTSTNSYPADPRPHIQHADDAVGRIPPRTLTIDEHTDQIVQKSPERVQVLIGPHTTGIRTETALIRDDASQAKVDLQRAQEESGKLLAERKQLEAEVQHLEQEKANGLRKLMGGIIWCSVIGIGVGATLFASGNAKTGLMVASASVATLISAVMVSQYAIWLATGVGLAAVAGISYVIWRLVVEKRATRDLVQSLEVAKDLMPPSHRKHLFATGGKMDVIQSSTTKAEVARLRGKDRPVELVASLPAEPAPEA